MNRRLFLTRIGKGLAAAAVLAHVPEQFVLALPVGERVRSTAALQFLRNAYNLWVGTRMTPGNRWPDPGTILLGPKLYDQVESEMLVCERFMQASRPDDPKPMETHLMFKAARCYRRPTFKPWHYEFKE